MKYDNTFKAKFLDRPNRFIAHVELEGAVETVHVKNTGRCRELLISGCEVILARSDNPARKTQYDLTTVYKKGLGWVNIDSQAPNQVVKEWLESGNSIFENITFIKPEYTFGNSRVDFYIECGENRKILLEVKGCTLEVEGKGYFPDAPTKRGTKHLNELSGALAQGYESYVAFVIAMPGVDRVYGNESTDPEFASALINARENGVKILNLLCDVTPVSLAISSCKL